MVKNKVIYYDELWYIDTYKKGNEDIRKKNPGLLI